MGSSLRPGWNKDGIYGCHGWRDHLPAAAFSTKCSSCQKLLNSGYFSFTIMAMKCRRVSFRSVDLVSNSFQDRNEEEQMIKTSASMCANIRPAGSLHACEYRQSHLFSYTYGHWHGMPWGKCIHSLEFTGTGSMKRCPVLYIVTAHSLLISFFLGYL